MGAHSPAGLLDAAASGEVLERVVRPAVAGLAAEARPFVGFLYAGLMLTAEGPRVLEFNVRLGDPEAQPLLLRLEDDLLPLLAEAAAGALSATRLRFRKEAAACVVLAARGYPEKPVKGEAIAGVGAAAAHPGVEIFHAGTARRDAELVSAGGRVLDVCAVGATLREALRRAYAAAAEISWPSKILRPDIGRRVVE
jgi:phosphoribosylamine--glycine ligase